MKTLHKHFSILLLILSFGALALLSACASPIPVDLRDADGNIRPAPTATATAAAVAALPETPVVVDTATPLPLPTETATAVATATATVEDTATPMPTATATVEDTATPMPTATATAEDTATPMPTATATAQATATAEPTLAAQAADTATPRPKATATTQRKATATSKPPTRTPTPDPRFTVAITEAELNKSVADAIAQNDSIAIDNVVIDLQSGQIVASGRTKIGFFTVDLKIVATVSVSNGKAVPEITEIYVNGASATGFVRQQVINMISPYLSQMTDLGEGVVVEKVAITDKDMTISGLQK